MIAFEDTSDSLVLLNRKYQSEIDDCPDTLSKEELLGCVLCTLYEQTGCLRHNSVQNTNYQ
jgi:hypothetical protein